MKVVFISTHFKKTGSAKSCRRLATAIQQHSGIELSMVVRTAEEPVKNVFEIATGPEKFTAFFMEKMEAVNYRLNEASREFRYYFSLDKYGLDISKHPEIQSADILHINWINNGFLSIRSLKKLAALGKPVVWSVHDMWPFTGGCHYAGTCRNYLDVCKHCKFLYRPGPEDMAWRSWKKKKAFYSQVNWKFVMTSKWLADIARESGAMESCDILSISSPVDTSLFLPKNKKKMRRMLGLPENKKLILFVAMDVNEKRKGFTFLEHALWHMKEERPACAQEYEIVIMGRTNTPILEKHPYKQHHLGFLEDEEQIVAAYNACDVYIMPSLEDNLPNTVLEAAACGLPVVAFNTGAIPEMVVHLKSGYIANKHDVLDLAKGIDWVLGQDSKALSVAARKIILDGFSFPVIANKFKSLYKQL